MEWQHRFERAKARLLSDDSICADNRLLFSQFFDFEEYKLKRQNGLAALDEPCYKTLYGYVIRFRNVDRWFDNRPWTVLTRADIKRVYDGLEDGTIRNAKGGPFRDRVSYYNKVFRSKPFRLAGKADLAKEVIEFYISQRKEVCYLTEEMFRRLVAVVSNPRHLFLLWLAWDVGENIGTLLRLTKDDFLPHVDAEGGTKEYLVRLPRDKLKRSRQERSEPLLFPETNRLAEMVLPGLQPHAPIMPIGYRAATKAFRRAVQRAGAVTMPHGDPVRWKDLRSGMACHLLKNGWSRDEVNARLGHTPRSGALDAYINYLALDRQESKHRLRRSLVPPVAPQPASHDQVPLQQPIGVTEITAPSAPVPSLLFKPPVLDPSPNAALHARMDRLLAELMTLRAHVARLDQGG